MRQCQVQFFRAAIIFGILIQGCATKSFSRRDSRKDLAPLTSINAKKVLGLPGNYLINFIGGQSNEPIAIQLHKEHKTYLVNYLEPNLARSGTAIIEARDNQQKVIWKSESNAPQFGKTVQVSGRTLLWLYSENSFSNEFREFRGEKFIPFGQPLIGEVKLCDPIHNGNTALVLTQRLEPVLTKSKEAKVMSAQIESLKKRGLWADFAADGPAQIREAVFEFGSTDFVATQKSLKEYRQAKLEHLDGQLAEAGKLSRQQRLTRYLIRDEKIPAESLLELNRRFIACAAVAGAHKKAKLQGEACLREIDQFLAGPSIGDQTRSSLAIARWEISRALAGAELSRNDSLRAKTILSEALKKMSNKAAKPRLENAIKELEHSLKLRNSVETFESRTPTQDNLAWRNQ